MSTNFEPQNDLEKILWPEARQHNNIATALSETQSELQRIKDKRLEERWMFVTALILLLDVMLLTNAPVVLIIFICTVEFFVLITLAEKWGVQKIAECTDRLEAAFYKWCDFSKSKQ